jgi:hypothetical protein
MIAQCSPARDGTESRSARVKRELLAETNGLYTTSELSYFFCANHFTNHVATDAFVRQAKAKPSAPTTDHAM